MRQISWEKSDSQGLIPSISAHSSYRQGFLKAVGLERGSSSGAYSPSLKGDTSCIAVAIAGVAFAIAFVVAYSIPKQPHPKEDKGTQDGTCTEARMPITSFSMLFRGSAIGLHRGVHGPPTGIRTLTGRAGPPGNAKGEGEEVKGARVARRETEGLPHKTV